ncbi:hypothetical protein NQ315_016186 [Exocentrus adspersus]|uniref:SUN domain-containing protein n=1 Tax=Exocentrus adspersus TaxID=1586481 RepID=A0AAV8V889_9CUCU|nr:hypothetical protein NQ315_016186 [Exocentrus adspersus]
MKRINSCMWRILVMVVLWGPSLVLNNSTKIDLNMIFNENGENISSGTVIEKDHSSINSVLEPSIDINDNMVKDNLQEYNPAVVSNSEENSDDSKNFVNNNTPMILTLIESSTIEMDNMVDASLVSTVIEKNLPIINENNLQINSTELDDKNGVDVKTNITYVSSNISDTISTSEDPINAGTKTNLSEGQNEEIPSFSEWAQKRLEEVEKSEQINSSLRGQASNGKGTTAKLRWKNYASLDCGAKVIAANPESVSPGAILSPSSDEYKLNACTSRIWFVVELCEAIQTKRIDLANYELFSSSPKDFIVLVSDRYPTRDWSVVGKFTAKDERDIQSFNLDTQLFAAEVLGNKVNNHTHQNKHSNLTFASGANLCITPSYKILCKNCSDSFFEQVYELVSCENSYIRKLVEIPLLFKALNNSWLCRGFGYGNHTHHGISVYMNSLINYIKSFFPSKYVCAMCQEISVLEHTGIPNVSPQFLNRTGYITNDEIFNIKVEEPYNIYNSEHSEIKLEALNTTQLLNLPNVSSTVAENFEKDFVENVYVSQIKPTKTLTSEVHASQTNVVEIGNHTSQSIESSENSPSIEQGEFISNENVIDGNTDNSTEIEGMDSLDDHLYTFIPDYSNNQNVPASTSTSTNTPQAQKESVFLRLSNRIKMLERNMSLSSQYLEELSRRYKKQVEEMQHLLEKTIVTLNEETQKKDLRNKQLEDRLDNLTIMMESLVAERHNWILSMYCLITTLIIILGIYFFCRKSTAYSNSTPENKDAIEILRRKSIDVVTHNLSATKRRRPSDQALKIFRSSALNNDYKHKPMNQRQRKRKKRNLLRSNSISNIKSNVHTSGSVKSEEESTIDWIEKHHQVIEDIPFALEESDHMPLDGTIWQKEFMGLNSTNGMPDSFSNSKLYRTSSQNHVSHSKTQSESSHHTENNYCGNAQQDSSNTEPVKKGKKSIKNFFKKVF